MEKLTDSLALSAEFDNALATINGLIGGFFSLLPKLAIALVVFALIVILAGFIRKLVSRVATLKANKSIGIALGRLAHVAVIFLGLLVAVAVITPSVDAGDLLQILGVGSVAIGFAFRDILQNFLAGLIILFRRPFVVGDWIKFSSYEGIVRDISTRSTWIKTFSGRDVSIPNGELFTNPVMVMTKDPLIRGDYAFGIAYDADIDKAEAVILETLKSFDTIRTDKEPDVGVTDLADSAVVLTARWWTTTADAYTTKLAVLKAVKKALDAAEIEIPFPHRQLVLPEGALPQVNDAAQS